MLAKKKFNFIQNKLPHLKMNKYHRYTTPSGDIYSSVTTMLKKTQDEESQKGLIKWRENVGEEVAYYIMKNSALIGTQTHTLNEDYLNSMQLKNNFHLLAYAHHQNFIQYLNKIDNIHGTELQLFSDTMKLAGTADCIAEYDGKLSIIDYKTKKSYQRKEWMMDYFIQATTYTRMYHEMTGKKIDQIVILVSSEENTKQEFIVKREDYEKILDKRLSLYK